MIAPALVACAIWIGLLVAWLGPIGALPAILVLAALMSRP